MAHFSHLLYPPLSISLPLAPSLSHTRLAVTGGAGKVACPDQLLEEVPLPPQALADQVRHVLPTRLPSNQPRISPPGFQSHDLPSRCFAIKLSFDRPAPTAHIRLWQPLQHAQLESGCCTVRSP